MSEGAGVGRGALQVALAKGWFVAMSFATNFVLPNLLTAEAVGDWGVVNRVVSLLNMVLVTGTIQTVSKFVAEEPEGAARTRALGLRLMLWLGGGLSLLYLISAGLLADVFRDEGLAAPFMISALIPACYALYAVHVGTLNGLCLFAAQARFDMAFSTLKAGAVLAAAILGAGVFGVLGAFAMSAAAIMLVALVDGRRRGWGSTVRSGTATDGPSRRLLVTFGLPVMAFVMVSQALLSVDLFFIKRADAASAAEFTGAYYGMLNLALVPTMLLVAVNLVAFPMLARAMKDGDTDRLGAIVHHGLRACLLLALAFEVVLAASPEQSLGLVYPSKPEWIAHAAALAPLALAYALLCVFNFMTAVLNATGAPRTSLVATAVVLALQAALCLALVFELGPLGAAIASCAAFTAGALGLSLLLRLRRGAGLPVLTLLRAALAGAVAFAVGRTLELAGPAFVAECLLVVAAFAAVLVLTGELGRRELRFFMGALRRA